MSLDSKFRLNANIENLVRNEFQLFKQGPDFVVTCS